jgi:hypothetical protein
MMIARNRSRNTLAVDPTIHKTRIVRTIVARAGASLKCWPPNASLK